MHSSVRRAKLTKLYEVSKQQTAQRNAYADLLEGHIARTRTAVAEALEESTQEAQKVEVVIVSDAMEQDDS